MVHSLIVKYIFECLLTCTVCISSRIERPGDHDVNVFRVYEDAFTYYEGNPNLKPERSYSIEVGHGLNNKLFTTLSLSQTNNVITYITMQGEQEGQIVSRTENIGKYLNYTLSVMYNHSFTSWWNSTNYINAFRNEYSGKLDSQNLSNAGNSWTLNSKHSFHFPLGLRSELLGYYNSPVVTGIQKRSETYGVDLAVEKKLFADRAMLKLAANGLIRNAKPGFTSNYTNLKLTQVAYPDNRKIMLSISYRFGA